MKMQIEHSMKGNKEVTKIEYKGVKVVGYGNTRKEANKDAIDKVLELTVELISKLSELDINNL